MIIFLYGPDSYRRQEKLEGITADYKKKHSSLSIENFDLEDENALDVLKDFLGTNSLFDSFKLGIVTNISSPEESAQKRLLVLIKDNLGKKESVLILISNKKPTKECKFLLEKPVIFQEFENLTGDKLYGFLEKEAGERGLVLDKESLNLLCQAYGGDTWGLITELDKLSLLDEKRINKKILENHLDIFLPVNIYDTIYKMRDSKNVSVRLSLLEELFSRSEDPAMIFNITAVFSYADKKWKNAIADYDAAIKSGKLEYKEALLDLCLENSK